MTLTIPEPLLRTLPQTSRAHRLDNLYEGLPIFIISTGTSLRGFDFSRLNGRITIGINRIIEHYTPSIIHFIDITAHATHAAALRNYNGMIIAGENAAPLATNANSFEIIHNVDTFELAPGQTELSNKVGRSFADGWFGSGAGCTALHTAILLGGNPIYLLGYDYHENNGSHFDEYDVARNKAEVYAVSFSTLNRLSEEPWLPRIYNCNPKSRLKCFEYADIDTVLAQEW
jgi:hypothetical protein